MYQLPGNFEVAANLFGKQGTPYPLSATRLWAWTATQRVLITPTVDDGGFKDLWDLDLRLAKNMKFGAPDAVTLTADLFNVFNSNTELNRQRNLQATNFHLLTDNLSPRILRIGMRLGF